MGKRKIILYKKELPNIRYLDFAIKKNIQKRIVVYPAMWSGPTGEGTIYVRDALIKYAKPYAVQKILDGF